jgi:hypothetical protein
MKNMLNQQDLPLGIKDHADHAGGKLRLSQPPYPARQGNRPGNFSQNHRQITHRKPDHQLKTRAGAARPPSSSLTKPFHIVNAHQMFK